MVTKLKLLRVEMDIKQKDLAKKIGTTPQYLRLLEIGKAKNPSIDIMKKLAKALNTDVQTLFFSED